MSYLLRRRRLGRTSCRAITQFSATGIGVHRSDGSLPETDLIFRWGCTTNAPSRNVVNRAEAIHRVSDKAGFRAVLDEHELCPKTWFEPLSVEFPCIVRPRYHHQGRHLYVCQTLEEAAVAMVQAGPGWYASPIINKVAEYRIFVVQGRCVCVARKFPRDAQAIAWNVAQGGRFENVRWEDWPLRAVRVGIEAFGLSGLDFGGVDVMEDGDGAVYVLEINSAPSLTSEYRQRCFAKAFDWIVRNGKDPIPLVEARGGYKKFIHPAICSQALLREGTHDPA